MPLEHHNAILRSGKNGFTSRHRQLMDGAHQESVELWQHSSTVIHPNSNIKDSIAQLVTLGQKQNLESLPYNTFRDKRIPFKYQTMSIDQYAEPDSQPLVPNFSPLEFASLMNVSHLLPPDYLHDKQASTFSTGSDDIMRAGKDRKWKTSYSKKSGRSVPYQRTDRTSTTLGAFTAAQASKMENSNITTSSANSLTSTTNTPKSFVNPATMGAISRLALKALRMTGGGTPIDKSDPDLLILWQQGINSKELKTMIQLVPGLENFAGVPALLQIMADFGF